MDFEQVTYQGPAIDDLDILDRLSPAHRALLTHLNGVVAFGGGLHIRGACRGPAWHALRTAWDGPLALYTLYNAVRPSDIPFAEDAVGDQFLLRDGVVHRLEAETGEIVSLDRELTAFLEASCADPIGFLQLAPLQQFWRKGGRLGPGQLLSVYPPFCTDESRAGVSLRAISAAERIGWLADFAAQIQDLPDGTSVQIKITP
jgi:hypothetical protein